MLEGLYKLCFLKVCKMGFLNLMVRVRLRVRLGLGLGIGLGLVRVRCEGEGDCACEGLGQRGLLCEPSRGYSQIRPRRDNASRAPVRF